MVCIKVIVRLIGRKYQADFQILRATDDAPVAGAAVNSGGMSGTTDAAGAVSLGTFAKGTHQYTITHDDFENFAGEFVAPQPA